jgi:hypothetical protein
MAEKIYQVLIRLWWCVLFEVRLVKSPVVNWTD